VLIEHLEKAGEIERLREVIGCPRAAEALNLWSRRIGAHHDDGDMAHHRVGFELQEHIVPGEIRQMEIEQDQVRLVFAGEIKTHLTLHGREQFDAAVLGEHVFEEV
jgi:hypothetical protein